MIIKNLVFTGCCILTLAVASCEKGKTDNADRAAINLAWAITQEDYLWYKNLPVDLNTNAYNDPNALMESIRKYSIEPGFTDPVDRWSFAIKREEWDDISSGISGDFGLNIFFKSANDLRVSYVEPNSPAGRAGIKRAWQIKSVNNNTTIATDDANINRIVDAVYNASTVNIVFTKPDGSDVNLSLSAETYQEQPIYLDSIYTVNGKKTGYLVYNSFLGNITNIKSRFSSIFTRFKTGDIQELVVDLRYNGGGYVELQNELANYLVPVAGNSGIMLKEEFNDKLAPTDDTTIYYSKKGNLDLSRIFFITTKNTASASELLINSLKPYMDVKLVGQTTHGKAVGYAGRTAGDWYAFPVSFRSVNKNDEGNYFSGLPTDATVSDGLDKDWGDINENCLASVFNYIGNGSFSRVSPRTRQDEWLETSNTKLDIKTFKGAVSKIRMN